MFDGDRQNVANAQQFNAATLHTLHSSTPIRAKDLPQNTQPVRRINYKTKI